MVVTGCKGNTWNQPSESVSSEVSSEPEEFSVYFPQDELVLGQSYLFLINGCDNPHIEVDNHFRSSVSHVGGSRYKLTLNGDTGGYFTMTVSNNEGKSFSKQMMVHNPNYPRGYYLAPAFIDYDFPGLPATDYSGEHYVEEARFNFSTNVYDDQSTALSCYLTLNNKTISFFFCFMSGEYMVFQPYLEHQDFLNLTIFIKYVAPQYEHDYLEIEILGHGTIRFYNSEWVPPRLEVVYLDFVENRGYVVLNETYDLKLTAYDEYDRFAVASELELILPDYEGHEDDFTFEQDETDLTIYHLTFKNENYLHDQTSIFPYVYYYGQCFGNLQFIFAVVASEGDSFLQKNMKSNFKAVETTFNDDGVEVTRYRYHLHYDHGEEEYHFFVIENLTDGYREYPIELTSIRYAYQRCYVTFKVLHFDWPSDVVTEGAEYNFIMELQISDYFVFTAPDAEWTVAYHCDLYDETEPQL